MGEPNLKRRMPQVARLIVRQPSGETVRGWKTLAGAKNGSTCQPSRRRLSDRLYLRRLGAHDVGRCQKLNTDTGERDD